MSKLRTFPAFFSQKSVSYRRNLTSRRDIDEVLEPVVFLYFTRALGWLPEFRQCQIASWRNVFRFLLCSQQRTHWLACKVTTPPIWKSLVHSSSNFLETAAQAEWRQIPEQQTARLIRSLRKSSLPSSYNTLLLLGY